MNETTRVAKAVAQAVTNHKAKPASVHEKMTRDKSSSSHTQVYRSDTAAKEAPASATTTYGLEQKESAFWTLERIEKLVKVLTNIYSCTHCYVRVIYNNHNATLQQLVADHGVGDWNAKAKILSSEDTGIHSQLLDAQGVRGSEVAKMWFRIKPIVKIQLKSDDTRACGHTCGTCPTRSTCHLHDAVDIEDM